MAAGTTIPATPPFAPGAVIWRRYGPLPVWGYGAVLLVGVLVFMYLRRGKAASQQATAVAGQDASTIAANTPKAPIFILPQTGLAGPAGPAGPAGNAGPVGPVGATGPAAAAGVVAGATDTVPAAPAGSGRSNPPGVSAAATQFLSSSGDLLSVGAGANLYDAADSAGLSGPPGHAQFAALNPKIWLSTSKGGNTNWVGTTPFAARGMPYRIR